MVVSSLSESHLRRDRRVWLLPWESVATVVRLAVLAGVGIDRQPDLATTYLQAKGRMGDATELLWQDVVRDDSPLGEVWQRLRQGVVKDDVTTRHALLLLVLFDGWQRIKECGRSDCTRVFVDASNGISRRHCMMYVRGGAHT